MRVLIGCPTYRLEPETVAAIFHQTWGGSHDVLFTRDNPLAHPKRDHVYNFQKLRKAALDGGYDALLTVESDIIPPADALERLLVVDSPLVFGAYMLRRGAPCLNICRYLPDQKGPDESLSRYPKILNQSWGRVIPCSGIGLGCTLIRRNVLEAIDFRYHECGPHCDWNWVQDCLKAGYRMMAHLGVLCGHKKPTGEILYPRPDGKADVQESAHIGDFNMVAAYQQADPQ